MVSNRGLEVCSVTADYSGAGNREPVIKRGSSLGAIGSGSYDFIKECDRSLVLIVLTHCKI